MRLADISAHRDISGLGVLKVSYSTTIAWYIFKSSDMTHVAKQGYCIFRAKLFQALHIITKPESQRKSLHPSPYTYGRKRMLGIN